MNLDDQVVEVYWNLHKKCFSVRYCGQVVAYASKVYLKNPQFKVSKSGRKRVLAEGRKNVHAVVRGVWTSSLHQMSRTHICAYNPYKNSTFITQVSQQPIFKADACTLVNKKAIAHFIKGR